MPASLPRVPILTGLVACSSLFWTTSLWAASVPQSGQNQIWNLIIFLFVLLVCAASAFLSVVAWSNWQSLWRMSAAAPLVVFVVWVAIILVSRLLAPGSHPLWVLEMFGWAMLNMIYMGSLMMIRRIFDKSDKEKSISG